MEYSLYIASVCFEKRLKFDIYVKKLTAIIIDYILPKVEWIPFIGTISCKWK